MKNKNQPARCPHGINRRYTKRLDGIVIWKQCEDLVIPRLHLSVYERAVYLHLVRHSRLEGKARVCFSIARLAQGAGLTKRAASNSLRGLRAKGALRFVERGRAGHVVEVRLPEEIRAVREAKIAAETAARASGRDTLEEADFLETRALREAIHRREGGRCFYCMRRLAPMTRCLDHVTPRARNGGNTYRNVVSACVECNSQKGERRADDFLRWLYREGHLTAEEFRGRLRALHALASGKLRPSLAAVAKPAAN
jgi:hypothetical protein